LPEEQSLSGTRVLACCGGMVVVFGAERMSFEVLRALQTRGAAIHCIVNSWENHRILELVERLGASHSTGRYRERLTRRSGNPIVLGRMLWDVALTSLGLVRDSLRFRPTHVFMPDHGAVLRNALALPFLRIFGVRVIFRLPNSPERGRFYERLWRHTIAPQVDLLVPNSRFCYGRLVESGVPESKIRLIRNAVVRRDASHGALRREASALDFGRPESPLVVTVGQILEEKGTHDAVEVALRLRRRGIPVRLAIVGRRPKWPAELVSFVEELETQVRRAGEETSIRFVGEVQDVLSVMRRASLLLAPIRLEETFGNVILEARSVGLPVVCSDRGGLPELVVHDQTGLICPAGDVDAFERAVEALVTDRALRERLSKQSLRCAANDSEVRIDTFERSWASAFGPGRADRAGEADPAHACWER